MVLYYCLLISTTDIVVFPWKQLILQFLLGSDQYHGFPVEMTDIAVFLWKQKYLQWPTFHCHYLHL